MKHIEFIENFEPGEETHSERDIETRRLYQGSRRQLMEVKLRNNAVLSKHKAAQPITVFCLSGNGRFLAGQDLSEEQLLTAGTLITLAAEIEHSAVAEPDLHLLVTKFLND